MPLGHRLLRAVSERIRWRGELNRARNAASSEPYQASAVNPKGSSQ
jgi:hypothetical protein